MGAACTRGESVLPRLPWDEAWTFLCLPALVQQLPASARASNSAVLSNAVAATWAQILNTSQRLQQLARCRRILKEHHDSRQHDQHQHQQQVHGQQRRAAASGSGAVPSHSEEAAEACLRDKLFAALSACLLCMGAQCAGLAAHVRPWRRDEAEAIARREVLAADLQQEQRQTVGQGQGQEQLQEGQQRGQRPEDSAPLAGQSPAQAAEAMKMGEGLQQQVHVPPEERGGGGLWHGEQAAWEQQEQVSSGERQEPLPRPLQQQQQDQQEQEEVPVEEEGGVDGHEGGGTRAVQQQETHAQLPVHRQDGVGPAPGFGCMHTHGGGWHGHAGACGGASDHESTPVAPDGGGPVPRHVAGGLAHAAGEQGSQVQKVQVVALKQEHQQLEEAPSEQHTEQQQQQQQMQWYQVPGGMDGHGPAAAGGEATMEVGAGAANGAPGGAGEGWVGAEAEARAEAEVGAGTDAGVGDASAENAAGTLSPRQVDEYRELVGFIRAHMQLLKLHLLRVTQQAAADGPSSKAARCGLGRRPVRSHVMKGD